jgi:hypothetical protein
MLVTSAPVSTAHCIPPTTCDQEPVPPGSTSPCMRLTSGATPMYSPLAFPPETVPLVCVPCVSVSWGSLPLTWLPLESNSAHPPGYVGSDESFVYRSMSG